MRKKLVALLMSTVLVSGLLAGCGGQDKGQADTQTAGNTGEMEGDITFWHSFTQAGGNPGDG